MTLTKVPSLHLHLTFLFFSVRLRDLGRISRPSYATVIKPGRGHYIVATSIKTTWTHSYSSPGHGGKWPSRTIGRSELAIT